MATPAGAKHRDLEQRLRNMEQQLREARDAIARLSQQVADLTP